MDNNKRGDQNPNKVNVLLYIFITIAFVGLVVLGIMVLTSSYSMYEQSKTRTAEIFNKAPTYQGTPNYTVIQGGYSQALFYFTLALGVLILGLLLPRIQNVSISPTGGITLTLRDIQQNITNIVKQQNSAQASSVGEGSIKPLRAMMQAEREDANEDKQKVKEVFIDTQKGKWGGKNDVDGRFIQAVIQNSEFERFYKVILTVKTTNGEPLRGVVKFHLHESFINPNPVITPLDGEATLTLRKVDCAFTVGAETDDGTELELDLATVKDAPKAFKECKA